MIADLQKPQESRRMRSHYLYQVGMLQALLWGTLVWLRSSAWRLALFSAQTAVQCCHAQLLP